MSTQARDLLLFPRHLEIALRRPLRPRPDERPVTVRDILDRGLDHDRRRVGALRRRFETDGPGSRLERDFPEPDRIRSGVYHSVDGLAVELQHDRDLRTPGGVGAP